MQKITPFLWFDNQAEEAVKFYVSLFKNSKINNTTRYNEESAIASGREAGSVMTIGFELLGQKFAAINGGPVFKFNPSISLSINLETEDEVDKLWSALIEGGIAMMDLGKYDWSEKYGWLQDKYGVSWQISIGQKESLKNVIMPSMLFVGDNFGRGEEALNFYTSLFENSEVCVIVRVGEEKGESGQKVLYSQYNLNGSSFILMENEFEHAFNFNEAVSFVVNCKGQDEVDYFWNKFTADGTESMCGWLKDKFGVSWQIVPEELHQALGNPDPEKARKAMQAMLGMKKIIIADL
ncbi:MAG: VOC family protein [Bacteroidetes bacterium]|nr:VOC family protein [Bacteroidota bacterium]